MEIYRRLFGGKLREARKAVGLTQAAVAEKLGVEPSTVSRWETGKDFPEDHRIPDLCTALGITKSYFEGSNAKLSDLARTEGDIKYSGTAMTEALVEITRLSRENADLIAKNKALILELEIRKLTKKAKHRKDHLADLVPSLSKRRSKGRSKGGDST